MIETVDVTMTVIATATASVSPPTAFVSKPLFGQVDLRILRRLVRSSPDRTTLHLLRISFAAVLVAGLHEDPSSLLIQTLCRDFWWFKQASTELERAAAVVLDIIDAIRHGTAIQYSTVIRVL